MACQALVAIASTSAGSVVMLPIVSPFGPSRSLFAWSRGFGGVELMVFDIILSPFFLCCILFCVNSLIAAMAKFFVEFCIFWYHIIALV